MTTSEEAMAIAQEFLDRDFPDWHLGVFVAEDMGPAYVVHHNYKKYLETMDPADAMGPGLGPIGVPKDGSAPWMLGSAPSFAEQVATKYGTA